MKLLPFLFCCLLGLFMPSLLSAQKYLLTDTTRANQLLSEADTFAIKNKCDSSLLRISQANEILTYLHRDTCTQLAKSWIELAWCYYKTKDYNAAISTNQKALNLQLSYSTPLDSSLYLTYIIGGRILRAKGDTLLAINWFKNALLSAWYNQEDLSDALGGIMDCTRNNKVKQSVNDFRLYEFYKFLTQFINTLSKRPDYERPKTVELLHWAATFDTSHTFFNKIYYLNEAINMQNRLSSDINRDTLLVGFYEELGVCLTTNSKETESFVNFEKGLNISKNVFGENHYKTAVFYHQIGSYYSIMSFYDKALENLNKALIIKKSYFGFMSHEVAEILGDIARCYGKMTEYDQSIAYRETILRIYKEVKKGVLDSFYIANAYHGLGYAYERNRDYRMAIKSYEDALNIKAQFTENLEHNLLSSLGTSYFHLKDYKNAIKFLELSHINHEKNKTRDILVSENELDIVVLFYLSRAYDAIGDVQGTQKSISEIRKNIDSSFSFEDKFFIQLVKGRVSEIERDYKKAISEFQKISLSKNRLATENPQYFTYLLFYWAIAHKKLYENQHDMVQLDSCYMQLKYLCQSIKMAQEERVKYSTVQSNLYISDNNIFEVAIPVNLQLYQLSKNTNYLKEAFTYFEQSKTFNLNIALRDGRFKKFAGISDSILEKEKSLGTKITISENRRSSLSKVGSKEADSLVILLDKELLDLRQNFVVFKKSLEKDYPKYYRLKYDFQTVGLDDVQQHLLRGDTTSLLSYFVGDSSIFVYVVRKDTLVLREIKKDFPLEEWVAQMREGIYGYYSQPIGNRTDKLDTLNRSKYVQTAYNLYQKLIVPVDSFITHQLTIIPDGVLGNLPFDALLTKMPEKVNSVYSRNFQSYSYWGDSTYISYAYSAASLKEMMNKQHQPPPQYNGVLALAPFSKNHLKWFVEKQEPSNEFRTIRVDTLSTLPNSGEEVKKAQQILGGTYQEGKGANKVYFMNEAPKYRIILLSTHAQMDDKVGDDAYFALSLPDDATAFEKFYVRDIYNLSLNADLVIQSACETGIGELKRGEGIISIARAFAYAGAKSLVTSLWQVNDFATGKLMALFYENLNKGMSKDMALWQAKIDFKAQNKYYAHPYFWSGFIPIGDMRPLNKLP